MPHSKPFKRTARHFVDLSYKNNGRSRYIRNRFFAEDGRRYIRAAIMLQNDLLRLFEFIEPAESNFNCYSFRVHELLTRASIEIEANFKAVLRENNYRKAGIWNIQDYRKLEATHLLSMFQVKVPDFLDPDFTFTPFENWIEKDKPAWHMAYNSTKHDRHAEFQDANLKNLLNAMAGLFAVLAAQFHTEDLSGAPDAITLGSGATDGFHRVAGDLFRVKFPILENRDDMYDFEHSDISDDPSSFQTHDYT